MKRLIEEILELTADATTRPAETGIPRVVMIKGNVPQHQLSALYQPMIGFVVQGTKVLSIGGRQMHLRAPSYFLLPIHLPASGSVRSGPDGRPYLSVGLSLDNGVLQNLLRDLPDDLVPAPSRKFSGCDADAGFVEAWLRLLRLMKNPRDIPALAPVYEREILYRVLMGPQGSYLRQVAMRESNFSKISRTVQWLREHFKEPLDLKEMAGDAAMAITTFHRQFKRATGLSPIQFQKQLRLLEARNLLAFEGYAVAGAAYQVGYQSATQFNREYSRFFGSPPARDAAILRRIEGARTE